MSHVRVGDLSESSAISARNITAELAEKAAEAAENRGFLPSFEASSAKSQQLANCIARLIGIEFPKGGFCI